MRIRPGDSSEIKDLSALALRSKRHWGYDEDFIERCRAELTVPEHDVENGMVFVAEGDVGQVIGFFSLAEQPRPELKMLFVAPDVIGHGVGTALVRHALSVAKSRGWRVLVIESDPFAASFYESLGAELIGTTQAASTGRMLPLYEMRAEA